MKKYSTLLFFSFFLVLQAVASPRYNDIQQKSSHNSYARDEGLLDQLIFHRVRSIELDLFRNGSSGQDWRVMHIPFFDEGSNCYSLKDCFSLLKLFDEQYPDHEVVTVWFDMKNGFSASHTPNALEGLISRYISRSDVLKPADLFAACPSATHLRDTVTGNCAWPTLDRLKGKWIFVTTSDEYHTHSDGRLMFKADGVNTLTDVNRSSKIFLNTSSQDNNLSNNINHQGLVSRRYVLNSESAFNTAINGKVHHIATDKINFLSDWWSKTHDANNPLAWPFRCVEHCGGRQEKVDAIGIRVNSEDISGRSDHFTFAYQKNNTEKKDWTVMSSVTSSHVDRWAKSCLMARASLRSDSPYFSVCRPSDNHSIVTQWRSDYSDKTNNYNGRFSTPGNIDQDDYSFMRLAIDNNGRCATGFGSFDGRRWELIGSKMCFSEPLQYQGIAASSHGNKEVGHIFSNLRQRNGVIRLNDLQSKNIGTVRSAKFYESKNLSR
ncbi:Ca2+-dependent phosphoinositide-specific phospholipase C [Marinagarivorans algicola]|uniref:Ca2+-dependent phosphoinositide-specific phospholipase C n=1 Tax=Marinagarivorans algicola TaxID=1513270 RepID=UPI0006B8D45F|nr:Ca2+-dependent phosphoinositide-specific phospholipase C [Marinagarivorans algicola]